MTPAEKMATSRRKKLRRPKEAKRGGAMKCIVRDVRLQLGLTIRDVVKGAKVNGANLHRIENGGDTTIGAARRLCAFFGKTIDELWPPR